jgi:hypothetical protein
VHNCNSLRRRFHLLLKIFSHYDVPLKLLKI